MKNAEVSDYFRILSDEFPEWLNDYINTRELQTQKYISTTCGIIYTELSDFNIFYSSLDHSVAVALIVWNFTHDKKQTLAGLFHDISTPAFKHCIDLFNGDYLKQESTEDLTTIFIERSGDIMQLLKRDEIRIDDINDYHIYPIADNDAPRLSADRLEYSLSNTIFTYDILKPKDVAEIYGDIEVQKNESGEDELGFRTLSIAKKFVKLTSYMSYRYRDDIARFSMQFLTDLIKHLKADGLITMDQLYDLKESEIIKIIQKSKYCDVFNAWRNTKKLHSSKKQPNDVYWVKQRFKVRYIDPLCNGQRMSKISKSTKRMIEKNLRYDMDRYIYADFKFE